MNKIKIGILGATSYVAQGIIYHFRKNDNYELILLSRNPENISWTGLIKNNLDNFNAYNYDVIINCILADFVITEKYDNLIINYLKKNKRTLYINISSGAVYGKDFYHPVNENTITTININHIKKEDYYYINKIYNETKHRFFEDLNIVDIRLFSYFSRFVKLDSHYFLTGIINSLKNNTKFITTSENIIRDYINQYDFYRFIECCIINCPINNAFDIYSLCPIFKFEILEFFRNEYGLQYIYKDDIALINNTGNKPVYYSVNKKAISIGYTPLYTSKETISYETKELIKKWNM